MVPAGKNSPTKLQGAQCMKPPLSWHHRALYVAESSSGQGVFTKEALAKDIVIARLGGHVMTLEQEQQLPPPLMRLPSSDRR